MIASNNNNNFFIGMPFVKQNFDFAPRTIALLLSLLPVTSAWPAELHSIGARVAESADSTNFNQYDLTASFALPWSWRGEWWRLQTLLDTSIGMLKRYDDEGVIVSLGPALELWPGDSNWRLTAGIVPTLISEDVYRKRDLGGHLHFTSFIGAHYQVSKDWSLGYQLSHMSNANLKSPNPGLDLHSLLLSRSF